MTQFLQYKVILRLLLDKIRREKFAMSILFLSILITTACNICMPKFFGELASNKNLNYVVILACIFTVKMSFQYILSYQTTFLSSLFSLKIREDFLDAIIYCEQQNINSFLQGDIFHRVFNELGFIQGKVIFGTIYFLKDILFFIILLVSILFISKLLFFVLLIFIFLFYLHLHQIGKKIAKTHRDQGILNASLSAYFLEIMVGKEDLKIFHIENKIKTKVNFFSSQLIKTFKKISKQQGYNYLFIEIMLFFLIGSIIGILIFEGLSISKVISSTIYILLLLWPVREMNLYVNSLHSIFPSMDRVENLLKELDYEQIKNKNQQTHLTVLFYQKELFLDIQNLCFAYKGKPMLLNNITYTFKKGSYLIKGNNGSGKSTFLKILAGVLPASGGKLSMGLEVEQNKFKNIRLIQQVPFLFSGTIFENLSIVTSDLSESHVNDILVNYNLCDAFNNFENGLHTVIGENGKYISAGQKQLISIVRGLIENPPILLLDEITSQLSEELQTNIMNYIYTNRKDKINIFITHQSPKLVKHDALILLNNE
ncbi:MAG TPA: ABC transporter ATP-binding protein [Bacteroidia bacterium]|nr:ABC transporter ATP-binding protein [Bacteroidia bacterium]